jgi:type I restriction enzyme S subunit
METELGIIPEDWDVDTVAATTPHNIKNGIVDGPFGSNLKTIHYKKFGTPIITSGYVTEGIFHATDYLYVDAEKFRQEKRSSVRPGDIVMAKIGARCGASAILPAWHETGILSGNALKITVDIRRHSEYYVWQVLWNLYQTGNVETLRTVGAQPAISMASLKKYRIPLPPLDEQKAIAAALSDADGLINGLDELVTKKRAVKRAVVQQLLTGRTRLPGFADRWDTVRLSEVADPTDPWAIAGGPFGSNLKTSDYVAEGVRIIQLQNIGDGKFQDDYAIYTSEWKADELLSSNIYPGEIILSKMGDPVARACFVPSRDCRYLMASDGIRLAVDQKRFDKRFVHEYINSGYFRKRAIDASTGSTRQRIGLDDLKKLPFIAPSLLEQVAIANVLFDMESEIAALERRRDKTKAIKQGMMQALLAGRIRLVKPEVRV